MPEKSSFQILQAQYFFLMDNLSDLLARCQNEEQKEQVRNAYAKARDNFQDQRLGKLRQDDPAVQDINNQLQDAQTKIQEAFQSLQNISGIIQLISSAVSLGTKLLALAGAS